MVDPTPKSPARVTEGPSRVEGDIVRWVSSDNGAWGELWDPAAKAWVKSDAGGAAWMLPPMAPAELKAAEVFD